MWVRFPAVIWMQEPEPTRGSLNGIAYNYDGPKKPPGWTEPILADHRAPSVDLAVSSTSNGEQILATVEFEEFDVSAVVALPSSASAWLVATALDELGRELDHVLAVTRGKNAAATPEPERDSR